jgi:hypothetical protein
MQYFEHFVSVHVSILNQSQPLANPNVYILGTPKPNSSFIIHHSTFIISPCGAQLE